MLKGTYTYANGDKYVGEYLDNFIRHGQGTFTWAYGTQYVGEWQNDKRHGQGTLTGPDGDQYVGEWQNNKMHGQGTFTRSDGSKQVGIWSYNAFQSEKVETENNSASSEKSICSVNRSLFCSAQRVLDICDTYVNESAFNSCMYRFEEIGNTLERTYGLTNNEFVMGVTSCKC